MIEVRFIVDTGADRTTLMPRDAAKIRLVGDQLVGATQSIGVGGRVEIYRALIVVGFGEFGAATHLYEIHAGVMSPRPGLQHVPSLLGRDIINRWSMAYDPASDLLSFEPHNSDFLILFDEEP